MDERALTQFGHNALGQFKKDWTVAALEERFAAEDRDCRQLMTLERRKKWTKRRARQRM